MRGGAQSHLMRAFDGNFYVVKFLNNPQHPRVLVNEWIATHLAARIGLPVPVPVVVDVGEWLIRKTPELHIQLGGHIAPRQAGSQFGSQYVINPIEGHVFDYMPESLLRPSAGRVRNIEVFAGMLAFDKWSATPTGARLFIGSAAASANIPWPSSITAIASTPANGIFPIRRCVVSTA